MIVGLGWVRVKPISAIVTLCTPAELEIPIEVLFKASGSDEHIFCNHELMMQDHSDIYSTNVLCKCNVAVFLYISISIYKSTTLYSLKLFLLFYTQSVVMPFLS